MSAYWAGWIGAMNKRGTLSVGWRFSSEADTLPFVRCEIADLVTQGVQYAFCLKANTCSNRFTDFIVETSIVGELPPRDIGNLFYPSESRGSLTPLPTSERAWVLPMSTEVANVHIWIYVLAVYHGDSQLAKSLIPIIKVF